MTSGKVYRWSKYKNVAREKCQHLLFNKKPAKFEILHL